MEIFTIRSENTLTGLSFYSRIFIKPVYGLKHYHALSRESH